MHYEAALRCCIVDKMDDVVQPLLDKARLVSYSARAAWVFAMVKMLPTFLPIRVFLSLAELCEEKHSKAEAISSWIHLVDLIVAFDKRMQLLISVDAFLLLAESEIFIGPSTTTYVLPLFCACFADEKYEAGQFLDGEPELSLLLTSGDHKAPLIVEFALKIAWKMIEQCQNLLVGSHRIHLI
ncbi:hypothetical protein Nepgr_021402 [Nepenthes gracilis]|uniref:Uncharacterized protein n=1 Tax=Nepenthes gracilis TaxID=150966 RepID=A0AAD3XXB7_NEPGR|nr:hypothetical protein Nepgr_021402 [Nepenthes gracilis]